MVHRKLNRTHSHRQATIRNLVSNLLKHESIITTHAKAKEAQSAADKLITLAKTRSPNLDDAKVRAQKFIYLFGDIAERYKTRPSGYTRVLKLEPRLGDNAPQSILELVDGKRDMKFSLTARVVARLEKQGLPLDRNTKADVAKIYKYRENAEEDFRKEVEFMKERFYSTPESIANLPPVIEPRKKSPIQIVENPLLKNSQ
ncbi:hypothetical protein D0Z00_002303 [Geotrichum galactomycetum]|uniref:Uncharacterized protein n=1 Tax=Geotrichum galactomycetum TaxID=27317 RepID=A0ACB6V4M0_9ASCO|nr:hypothetical protein D0Z00_002303 [Geotrichum candidum]